MSSPKSHFLVSVACKVHREPLGGCSLLAERGQHDISAQEGTWAPLGWPSDMLSVREINRVHRHVRVCDHSRRAVPWHASGHLFWVAKP